MAYGSSQIAHCTVSLIVTEEGVGYLGDVVEFVCLLESAIHSPSGTDVPSFVIVRWDLGYEDGLNR